jgi:hypothetical protein
MVYAWIYRGPYAGTHLELSEADFYRANSEDWGEMAQATPKEDTAPVIAPPSAVILGKWEAAEAFWRERNALEPAPTMPRRPVVAMIGGSPPVTPLDPSLMVRRNANAIGYRFNSPPAGGADVAALPH